MSPKKRLAIVATHPVQYQAHWFRALARSSLDVEVLYGHRASAQDQAEAGFGVEFEWDLPLLDGYRHRFLKNEAKSPSVCRFSGIDTPGLGPLIAREKYDAVLVLGWHYRSAWQAMMACWKHRIPVMARSDSHLRTRRGLLKKALKWLPYRLFVGRLDACLAVGAWSGQYYEHYGASRERIFVVPHSLDPSWFDPREDCGERNEIRREWGFDEDQTVFLFVGKFVPFKRPLDFVSAVSRAAVSGSRVAGLMIGDGPLRGACETLVAKESAPVRFAGFLNQSQVARMYRVGDALTLPSEGAETWGLVVNEAMARGLPCLVSDQVGSGPDLIVPGRTGDIFRTGDVDDLRGKMEAWAEDPGRLLPMGVEARAMALTQSVETAVKRLEEAVDFVAARSRTSTAVGRPEWR